MPLLKGPARGTVRGDGFHFKAVVPRRQSKRIIGSSEIHSSDFVPPKDFARSFIHRSCLNDRQLSPPSCYALIAEILHSG